METALRNETIAEEAVENTNILIPNPGLQVIAPPMWPIDTFNFTEHNNSFNAYFISDVQEQNESEACSICRRTWESTANYPRTTNLCGHVFHTACAMLYYQDTQDRNCPYQGCVYNCWAIITVMQENRYQTLQTRGEEVIIATMQTGEYKRDLEVFKKSIRTVSSAYKGAIKEYKDARKNLIHKHIHSINQIQMDMNTYLKAVKSGANAKKYRLALTAYRKKARAFHLNHGLSFRDLKRRNIIKAPFQVTWALERHRSIFSSWQLSLRLTPGARLLRDPIQGDA